MPPAPAHEPMLNATRWRRLTAPLRLEPDFLIIGAMKAGTTSLYDILAQHPHVLPALRKEVHFFDRADRFGRGMRFYRAFFETHRSRARSLAAVGEPVLTGEASPYYLYHPLAPARVAKHLPRAKCIALLREPIARAWSHFQHAKRYKWEKRLFREAVAAQLADPARLERELLADPSRDHTAHQLLSYVHRGHYADQLERWFDAVGKDNVLVLNAERFYRETDTEVARVLDFLGLPSATLSLPKPSNAGGYKSDMRDDVRQQLLEHYTPHNERLYELLGERYDWLSA